MYNKMSSEQLEELMIMLYIKRNKLSSIRPFSTIAIYILKKLEEFERIFLWSNDMGHLRKIETSN